MSFQIPPSLYPPIFIVVLHPLTETKSLKPKLCTELKLKTKKQKTNKGKKWPNETENRQINH